MKTRAITVLLFLAAAAFAAGEEEGDRNERDQENRVGGRRRSGAGWYYFKQEYRDAAYGAAGNLRAYSVPGRKRPFFDVSADYFYEKYFYLHPDHGPTSTTHELYPAVQIGVSVYYGGQRPYFALAGGHQGLIRLDWGEAYHGGVFTVEDVTFINDWLGFWVKSAVPALLLPYFGYFYIEGGLAFAL